MFIKNLKYAMYAKDRRISRQQGLTLIEVVIATTLTLLILLALTASFKRVSDAVSAGRSRVTLSDQLRGILQTLNNDLEMRTTGGQTPENFGAGRGYFKYLDGGMSDWSATIANYDPARINLVLSELKKEDMLAGGSRWGDVDDILMFTAKARDGQLFRGKIPRAMMIHANWNAAIARGETPPPLPTDDDWAEDIAISSEFAEIIWFAIPLNLTDSGLYEASTHTVLESRSQVDNQMPRRMALCRKVLLIRPDLDITPPVAQRTYITNERDRLFYVQPTSPINESSNTSPINESSNIRAFETVNANAHQRCDLSVSTRTVLGPSGNVYLSYKTNSLDDLQNPQNRFAHGVYPLSTSQGDIVGATLPVMMLTNGINAFSLATCRTALSIIDSRLTPVDVYNGGFIPPFFMRVAYRRTDPTNWRTWVTFSTLQEMVTSDVLAFDLKAFDKSAPVLMHPGTDRRWGNALQDDDRDANSVVDNPEEAGWLGTDDVTVDPSHPGFWDRLTDPEVPIEVESGAYVDVGWAFRRPIPNFTLPANRAAFLVSEFSGMSSTGVSPSLIQGGAISVPIPADGYTIGNGLFIFQNAFDTFTTQYDSDGEQDLLGPDFGANQRFRYSRNSLNRYGYVEVSANPLANQDPLGVDVPPAYPSELRSIQATIRVQDRTAKTMQQISIIHSLVD